MQPVFSTARKVSDFATQFVKLEADNTQLRKDLTERVQAANKLTKEAWQANEDLKTELAQVKEELARAKRAEEQKKKEEPKVPPPPAVPPVPPPGRKGKSKKSKRAPAGVVVVPPVPDIPPAGVAPDPNVAVPSGAAATSPERSKSKRRTVPGFVAFAAGGRVRRR